MNTKLSIVKNPELENEIFRNAMEALTEDLGPAFPKFLNDNTKFESIDLTGSIIERDKTGSAKVIGREDATFCGKLWFEKVFNLLCEEIQINWIVEDGEKIRPESLICEVCGPIWAILAGERTALNFIQTFSGTATSTCELVELLSGSRINLLDTRKTIPGLRLAQKYAVTCGGGKNHRLGLFDEILIKENHIAASGDIATTIAEFKKRFPKRNLEIEVEDLDQLHQVIEAGVDIILLDNFSINEISQAVALINKRSKIEISGNITAKDIPRLIQLDIDYISVGALTKNVKAVDLSMIIDRTN